MKKSVAIILSAIMLALGAPAFAGCGKAELKFTLVEKDGESYYSVGVAGSKFSLKGDIVIPATYGENDLPVREIPAEAFRNSEITSVTIPASVKFAGNACFANCNYLTTVTIEEGGLEEISWGMFGADGCLREITVPSGIKNIRSRAFYECVNLTRVVLPEGLETIDTMAFRQCDRLEQITLPQSLTTIGDMAFAVSGLKEIIIPDGVRDIESAADGETEVIYGIGVGAFLYCESLKKVVVGASVQTIPMGAFCVCESLEEIYLPLSLKTVGGFGEAYDYNMPHPFYGNTKLTDVYYAGTAEDWAKIEIDETQRSVNNQISSNKPLLEATKHYGG